MAKAPTNMAKSVKDRLLNIARKEGLVSDVLLVRSRSNGCFTAYRFQRIATASS